MPSLLLLRHAKSSRDDPSLEDFERPLAARGHQDAPRMGREIARRGWRPDLVLVSPARRARQTWELASAFCADPPGARFQSGLYMAGAGQFLGLLHSLPDSADCILIIGHNPGMEEFALSLAGPGSKAKPLRLMREKFPTATVARFTFEGPWHGLAPRGARLTHFIRPRDLG